MTDVLSVSMKVEANMNLSLLVPSDEVAGALATGAPVVALESTIITHWLPKPRNLELAIELEQIVRDAGAIPATIAMLDGVIRVGLDKAQLEQVATAPGTRKLGFRDLVVAAAAKASGGTTVSATSYLAAAAGIRVFGTGGLGGVHLDWTHVQDESADLEMLSRTCITVVCGGVKSILDVPATLQRLETKGVTVVGFRTDTFPGFLLHSSGEPVDWRIDTVDQAVAIMRSQDALDKRTGALVVANAVPEADQLDPQLHAQLLTDARASAEAQNITGQAITPFMLACLARESEGAALEANLTLVRSNIRLAGEIAVAWANH